MNAMEISRTALDVEWRRLEIIAQNIANAGTTRTASGAPYRPLRLVSGPRTNFAAYLGGQGEPAGVEVYSIEASNQPARRVHEPSHPDADAEGFVSYPAFDHAGEMTRLVTTARIYEANLVAMSIARQMYAKAVEIGRRG
ncbi:MAG TPA: flagellar basal body rod protein FlgC [Allosphingosinicella sp.]|nr:flagellar basal body rod protein FlgC [Allosphingosinicella sp.]